MKIKSSLMFVFILILKIHALDGQSVLPTVIDHDTTLNISGSPYLIPGNLTVSAGVTLTIEPAVIIELGLNSQVNILGNLDASGTIADSIYFQSATAGVSWSRIVSTNANIKLSYVHVAGAKMLLGATGGDEIIINHSNIISLARGYGEDCIAVHSAKKVIIENISLKGAGGSISQGIKNDAIDLDEIDSVFIRHNVIWNFSDDGIDIGTSSGYSLISYNITHNNNFGVTIGETSTAYLDNILSYNNDGGFQVHTNATIYCHNNTLYGNKTGIECYHSEEGQIKQTGGTAIVKNTLFSNSTVSDITLQASSGITVSYSLSDKEILVGSYNLLDDPMLTDPANGNFLLLPESPCFNAGEPDSANNRINIGVFQIPVVGTQINHETMYSLYPNPATNFLWIDSKNASGTKKAVVSDLMGRVIISPTLSDESNSIDISSLTVGIYMILITDENQMRHVMQFIKE